MGWVYGATMREGENYREFFERELFVEGVRVVDCAVVKFTTAYLAVETDKGVYAEVCLLAANFRDPGRPVGYKAMSETMHPYYYDAPEGILDILDAPRNTDAAEWRRLCR